MFYSTNQSYHWKLNQLEVAFSGRLANQIAWNEPIWRGVNCNTSASEQYIRWEKHHWHSVFFDRPWPFSPARDAAKNLQRRPTWPGIWKPTWRIQRCLGRPIPVGYATSCSAELTTERDMKRPIATAWPAEYAISTSTEWTTSSEQKKTWRGLWRSWADMTSWSTSGSRHPIPSGSFICWPTWPST